MPDEEKDAKTQTAETPAADPGNIAQMPLPATGLRVVETRMEGEKLIITV